MDIRLPVSSRDNVRRSFVSTKPRLDGVARFSGDTGREKEQPVSSAGVSGNGQRVSPSVLNYTLEGETTVGHTIVIYDQ